MDISKVWCPFRRNYSAPSLDFSPDGLALPLPFESRLGAACSPAAGASPGAAASDAPPVDLLELAGSEGASSVELGAGAGVLRAG